MAVAAVTVYPSTTRIENADTTSGWGNDGGGGGVAVEPDIVYQGTGAASRKVSTTRIGRDYTHGSNIDMDGTPATTAHVLLKINAANYNALLTRTSPAMGVKIGSSSSAYYQYYLFGNDNYPATGGFQFIAVAPSVAGYRNATSGSPNTSAINYFSLLADFSATSKSENLVIDAIDVGLGLALVGGDGVSADAAFDDFVSSDEGTTTNRWGFVTTLAGVLFCIGELAIGRNNTPSAVATEFTDSGKTLKWRNGLVATGFNRLLLDLGGTGTVINMNNCSFGSEGQENNDGDRGYTTTEDSRPVLEVTGTTGSVTLTSCVIDNFSDIGLNDKVTLDTCVITNSAQIDCGSGTTGPDLSNTAVSGYTGAANTSAVLWTINADPDGNLDGMTIANPANAAHAIEFGTASPLSITLRDMTFTGFNASDSQNDSTFHVKRTSGTVTINLIGCSGNFSYRSDGATVNIVNNPVTVQVTCLDSISQSAIEGVAVTLTTAGSGPYPYDATVTISRTGSTATVSHTAHGLSTDQKVKIRGADQNEYNRIKTITKIDANSYSFQVSGSPTTPATGTIKCDAVIIDGLTNASGQINDSRVYSSNQAVSGFAAKGTSSPIYVRAPLSDTVDNALGLNITSLMNTDE